MEFNESNKNIYISRITAFMFTVSNSGKYELRIIESGNIDIQKKVFYVSVLRKSTHASFEFDKEGIEIK